MTVVMSGFRLNLFFPRLTALGRLVLLELQGDGIDAVTKSGWRRAVVNQVSNRQVFRQGHVVQATLLPQGKRGNRSITTGGTWHVKAAATGDSAAAHKLSRI